MGLRELPWWKAILALLGLLAGHPYVPYQQVDVTVPVSRRAARRRKVAMWVAWGLFPAGLIFFAYSAGAWIPGLVWTSVGVMLAGAIAGIAELRMTPGILLKRDGRIVIRRVHAAYAAAVSSALASSPVMSPGPSPVAAPRTQRAGWMADPSGQYELRYWDGQRWTERVSTNGQQSISPVG